MCFAISILVRIRITTLTIPLLFLLANLESYGLQFFLDAYHFIF